jgi:hypothetical protein
MSFDKPKKNNLSEDDNENLVEQIKKRKKEGIEIPLN